MIYKEILRESQRIQKEIQVLQERLTQYPPGKLSITCSGRASRILRIHDGTSWKYIHKNEKELRSVFLEKIYYEKKLTDLTRENEALQQYLSHHDKSGGEAKRFLEQDPILREYLKELFVPENQVQTAWLNETYQTTSKNPEHLLHQTLSGSYVRSKSEAMIANQLYLRKIPFRYECLLSLSHTDYYPDFTILRPKDNAIVYWEHLGLMDQSSYVHNAYLKLEAYHQHGIIPLDNLILTYETKNNPLSQNMINIMISNFLE